MFLVWRARRLLARILVVSVLLGLLVAAIEHGPRPAIPRPVVPAGGCHGDGGLPDRRCTPGAIRPGVSLRTICAYGYSRSLRPPESYTEPLKLRQMRAYHLTGSPSGYKEDHLIPLSIDGAPRDPANLWPEPRDGPNNAREKDQLETWLSELVCRRLLPLRSAQVLIAKNWFAALHWVERHYPWVVSD